MTILDNPSLVAPAVTVQIDEPLALERGGLLPGFALRFETYGTLNDQRDNAVLVCHSLTKGSHAAGRHAWTETRGGWWDAAIGPGKMLDTSRYFVICTDSLCAGGSTGPASLDPATGSHYGMGFPAVTVADMVDAQRRLVDWLGISRLQLVIGGCLGGQQAIQWAIRHPHLVANAVVITATPATSAHSIALFSVMRRLITADPAWNGGAYYGHAVPAAGLGAAIAAALPVWMSPEEMEARFGRSPAACTHDTAACTHDTAEGSHSVSAVAEQFAVEAFISRLVESAQHQLDANGLIYLTRAVEYFDLEQEYGSLDQAVCGIAARMLFVSYESDWRYPAAQTHLLHEAISARGGDTAHVILDSPVGHGAFLYEVDPLACVVKDFVA